jgi:hypothetical protein
MILFYNKEDGSIFATIDGRVHDEKQLEAHITNGLPVSKIGKYVIGWIEKKGEKMAYNLHQIELLQRFEDITPESPLDYKIDIETNAFIKK